MRPLAWVLLLAASALAADRLVLHNGGALVGHVVEEDDARVVLESGGMRLVLPRRAVERIERNVPVPVPERPEKLRDAWFAIGEGTVVGWSHLVETRTSTRTVIQVRDVFRMPDGGIRELRRVEETTPEGVPVALLVVESEASAQRIESARRVEGGVEVRRIDGEGTAASTVTLDGAWTFREFAVSRFLREASPDETAEVVVYEPGTGRAVLVMERLADRAGGPGPSRWFRIREGGAAGSVVGTDAEGTVLVRGAGRRRVSPEHAELIRRALMPERPLDLEKAVLHPLQRAHLETPDRERFHLPAGLSVELPSDRWSVVAHARSDGLVWTFEHEGLLASLEVFVFALPAPDADVEGCLDDAWRRIAQVVEDLRPAASVEARRVGEFDARVATFSSRHRAEEVAGVLAVVRADARMLMLVAGVPPDAATRTREECGRFLDTLVVAPLAAR